MSQSPATPHKLNAEAASSALASTHEPSSTSGLMRSSLHEPSPASTYGETTAGDSVPATPQDINNDPSTALLDSLRSVTLKDSVDRDYGSPLPTRAAKCFGRPEQHPIVGRDFALPAGPSPSTQQSNKPSSTSPVLEDRYEQIKHSPTWRHDGRFVRNSEPNSREDPFITSKAPTIDATSTSLQGVFKPREDRANLPLSADTAQAMLPPNACVFVANLTQSKSDDQLEHSVSEVFQAFGNVYVKIRRDGKGMPFAFCQYENVGDAQRAITMGRGLLIDGRACRTEVAKVNRSLYLSKVTGGPIPEDEARQILSRFGAIEKLWYCSQTDLEMFRLPEGVWVMFAFFQDCRDAQAGFRDDPTYRLEQPKMPEDMRTRLNVRSGVSPMHRELPRLSPGRYGGSPQAAIVRRASDICSIFVGNLPPDATDDKLRELFGMYGRIAHIEIVRKPSVNSAGVNTFAFLQFHTVEEAEIAARLFYQIDGHRLRVERKESAESLAQRENMFSGGSPRNRFPANAQDTMALLFQHGVSVGMANANASQSPTAAPPMYTPWSNYQQFGLPPMGTMPPGGRLMEHDAQAHASAFVPQTIPHGMTHGMSAALPQYQMPTITPAQTAQYMPYNSMAQRTTNYQWPPVTSPTRNPTFPKQDIH
ncbi:MAG: hypothetical protein L6R38_001641 [Xanthoria sp. 2 TBL-2021]|nr:MAG: hypothetical protein L6R42_000308 [Xanthoria sp. 1 TBL-2021]KAI4284143.1 MAG: hypothetical protein L6R38_001641 [Xanthoria sp. 2 TBL-2021]